MTLILWPKPKKIEKESENQKNSLKMGNDWSVLSPAQSLSHC